MLLERQEMAGGYDSAVCVRDVRNTIFRQVSMASRKFSSPLFGRFIIVFLVGGAHKLNES